MELDAGPELELPGRVVDRMPRQRKAGNQMLLLVLLGEVIEDVAGDRQIGVEIVEQRVDRGRLGPDRDLELLRRRRVSENQPRQQCRHGQNSPHPCLPRLLLRSRCNLTKT